VVCIQHSNSKIIKEFETTKRKIFCFSKQQQQKNQNKNFSKKSLRIFDHPLTSTQSRTGIVTF
jgi:hypothetical protein